MGQKFWGIDIQKEVAESMTPADLPTYILVKNPVAARGVVQSNGVNSKLTSTVRVHGAIITLDVNSLEVGQQIEKNDICLSLIGKPLADACVKIEINDFIEVEGRRRSVVWAKRDGADASWKVQLR